MRPILSILIATKNRVPYCINAIETILKFEDLDFELIVQDNTDTLELFEYVQNKILDKRFKYNYTPPPLSSIDNFNAVIAMATGEYLCLIGDDDGINPEIFKLVRWGSQNNIDAIVPGLNAIYWWPAACAVIDRLKGANGIIEISRITGSIKEANTANEIIKLLKNGYNYLDLNMPKLYHGIVKKEFMDKIKEHTGYYVGGLSPDIYIAVALTSFIKKIIKIDYPLTIPGICIASTSADSATNKNTARLEDTPHFRDRGPYSWSEQVPKFYSGINIWADSTLASLKDMKRYELLKVFNVTALSIALLKRHKEYSELILENYFRYKKVINPFGKWCYLCFLSLKNCQFRFVNLSYRALNKLKRTVISFLSFDKIKIVNPASFRNVENISKATNELSAHLLKHNLSIDIIINNLDTLIGRDQNNK